jgi:hypothetical protein
LYYFPKDDGHTHDVELNIRQRKTYERLKTDAQQLGDTQVASDFYFWQMWYRYYEKPWHNFSKLISGFYLLTSGFGLSVVRPFCCLVLFLLFMGGVYAILLG